MVRGFQLNQGCFARLLSVWVAGNGQNVVPIQSRMQSQDLVIVPAEYKRDNDDRDQKRSGSPSHVDCSCCLALPITLLAKDPGTLGLAGDFGDTSALPFDRSGAWKEDRRDGRPRQRLEVLTRRSV